MQESAPYSLLAELDKVKDIAHPPVHLWHPTQVKDIDMRILEDGSWEYLGGPITRQRLVRLFSTVLRLESDGCYYLVTPVEKCRIQVMDAPFAGVLMESTGEGQDQCLVITTNMAESVAIDADHPLTFRKSADNEALIPYVMVRDGLLARLNRNVYYQLMELVVDQEGSFVIWSDGVAFPVA